jgi:hypothetical protein
MTYNSYVIIFGIITILLMLIILTSTCYILYDYIRKELCIKKYIDIPYYLDSESEEYSLNNSEQKKLYIQNHMPIYTDL